MEFLYLAALALLLLVEPHRFYNRKKSMAAAAGMGDGSCGTGTSWMCIEASVGIRLLRFVVEKL